MSVTPKEELLAELDTFVGNLAKDDLQLGEELMGSIKQFIAKFGYLHTMYVLRMVGPMAREIRKRKGPHSRAHSHFAVEELKRDMPTPTRVDFSPQDIDLFFEGDW